MTSPNHFNTMEFSQQQMDFQDNMFGLSADLFADDLYTDSSILDFNLDGDLKAQSVVVVDPLEELLFQDTQGDEFGEEWMESVDVHSLLDTSTNEQTGVIEVKKVEPEPRKEGMKAAAFELLKALLTTQQPVKTDTALSLQLLDPAEKVETPVAVSPVAEVPNLDFNGCDTIELMPNTVETPQIHIFEDLIEIQPLIALDNGDVVEIEPNIENDSFESNSMEESASVWSANEDSFSQEGSSYIASPASSEDVDSLLSTSPSEASGLSTNDTSFLRERKSSSAKSIQVSSDDFTRLKSKGKNRSPVCPYDSDNSVSDKRCRKKVQNKNAATRYRVKKRQEKESLQQQEVSLSDKNKQLREKVESLQREIMYMKELMNEINKAKKSKI